MHSNLHNVWGTEEDTALIKDDSSRYVVAPKELLVGQSKELKGGIWVILMLCRPRIMFICIFDFKNNNKIK